MKITEVIAMLEKAKEKYGDIVVYVDRDFFWDDYSTVNDGEYSTKSSTWSFSTIPSLTANHPPNKPTNPSPPDGATNISSNPMLSVTVSDPDEDPMDISFYNANGTLIGTDKDVPSGDIASIVWHNLEHSTTYSWYAVADDVEYTAKSSTWSFTTKTIKPSGEDNYILWGILIIILIILLITLIYVRYVLVAKKRRAKRVRRHKKR